MKHSGLTVIVFFIVILTACRDEASTAGGKWVNSTLQKVFNDTCTVHLLTIMSDSIATSGDTIFQVGHYADEYRGDIRASFFVEFNVNTTTLDENEYFFDSLTLVLKPTGVYLGDTLTATQQINIHKLSETIELNDNYLYNTSSVPYEQEPFASYSFIPRPLSGKNLEIRLPDEMGREFLDKITRNADEFSSQERFRQYLKGFALTYSDNDQFISGFAVGDSSVYMKLYYHLEEETISSYSLHFSPSSTLHFTKVEHDRTGTPIESLVSGIDNALISTKTNNMAYLQGLTGIYMKIEFPYLNDLLLEGDLVSIESAVLYLYPVSGTYGEKSLLPQSLTLYTTDFDDIIEDVITDYTGSSLQTGSLVTDETHNIETYYTFDITSFIQTNLGTAGYNRKNLQLFLPETEFMTTLSNVIMGDGEHARNNVRLELTYTTYNK